MERIVGKVSVYKQETWIMAMAFIRGRRLLFTMIVACIAATNQGGYYYQF